MKKFILFAAAILFVAIFSQNSYGCSCVTAESEEKDPQKIKESARKFYLNEFKGAVFTGKVLKIESIEVAIDENLKILNKKITIQVEKYWLGVTKPEMFIYTGNGDGDCGVNFSVGNRYFFYPQLFQGKLQTGICDYVSDIEMDADGKSAKFFNEILGEAKTFETKIKK
jgi:hypothetical protein